MIYNMNITLYPQKNEYNAHFGGTSVDLVDTLPPLSFVVLVNHWEVIPNGYPITNTGVRSVLSGSSSTSKQTGAMVFSLESWTDGTYLGTILFGSRSEWIPQNFVCAARSATAQTEYSLQSQIDSRVGEPKALSALDLPCPKRQARPLSEEKPDSHTSSTFQVSSNCWRSSIQRTLGAHHRGSQRTWLAFSSENLVATRATNHFRFHIRSFQSPHQDIPKPQETLQENHWVRSATSPLPDSVGLKNPLSHQFAKTHHLELNHHPSSVSRFRSHCTSGRRIPLSP